VIVTLLGLNIFEGWLLKLSEDFTYYLEEILSFRHFVTRITVVVVDYVRNPFFYLISLDFVDKVQHFCYTK